MQKILDTKSFVASSVFVSKDEAAREFKKELGEDFEQVLGYNPLLPSIEIKLNPLYANNDSLVMIEKRLAAYDVIQEVSYQKSLVEYINDNIRKISIILLIAGAALVLISFTLIRNTIHLSVYSQRFLIKTMQLVGRSLFSSVGLSFIIMCCSVFSAACLPIWCCCWPFIFCKKRWGAS